jgi:hypothetical protein
MADDAEPQLSWLVRCGYGSVGAIAPELIRWTKIALHPAATDLPTYWPLYVSVFAAFIVANGVFAASWRDHSPIKCIYLGATFPAFITSVASVAPALSR